MLCCEADQGTVMDPTETNDRSMKLEGTKKQRFSNVIEVCQRQAANLAGECLLCEDLTPGKENPVCRKLEQAIAWTEKLKALCEAHHESDLNGLHEFVQKAEELHSDYERDFAYMRWVDASAAILKEHPADGELANKLEWRRHQIINSVSADGHLTVLRDFLSKIYFRDANQGSAVARVSDQRGATDDLPQH